MLIGVVVGIEQRGDRFCHDRIDGTVLEMIVALGPRQKGIHEQPGRLLVHGGMDGIALGVDLVISKRLLPSIVHHCCRGC